MERKELLTPEENKPDSTTNHIFAAGQGILISGITTVPTTSNGILQENQATIISNDLYWMRDGIVVKFSGSEST